MVSKDRYGPWALPIGGSEGIGEHLARKLGAAGINIILVARKLEALAQTSELVRGESGVEVLKARQIAGISGFHARPRAMGGLCHGEQISHREFISQANHWKFCR